MRSTAAVKTLGCKLNQYDSEEIRQALEAHGYTLVPFEGVADVYIVNSCTVTGHADKDTRKLARGAKRRNPQATVVVTGCYAQTRAGELWAIPEVDLVIGLSDRCELIERLGEVAAEKAPAQEVAAEAAPTTEAPVWPLVSRFSGHTRAFCKIQEGCNAACTYCIVHIARGRSRSRPIDSVLDQVRAFVAAGHREIVLVGVHLGDYGQDLTPTSSLTEIVARCLQVPGLGRLRLSSIEPGEITLELIALMANDPRLCRHFHLPIQSGDDDVLRRMGRPYDAAFVRDLTRRIHQAVPHCAIGADILVGFPGETAEAYQHTRALLEELPLSYLHVFSYSRRPGTPAAAFPDQVRPDVKKQRTRQLRQLSDQKRRAFARGQLGQPVRVLIENAGSEDCSGLSDNYLRVRLPAGSGAQGELISAVVQSSAGAELLGRPCAAGAVAE